MRRFLKRLLELFNKPTEYEDSSLDYKIESRDVGSGHYLTGLAAKEYISGQDKVRNTYQIRCSKTYSNGWVTPKNNPVIGPADCCGGWITIPTRQELEGQ